MSTTAEGKYSVVDIVRQSPPLDLSSSIDESWVKGKTILITGGASGFGEALFRRWAAAGAFVTIGDVNVKRGDQVVRDVSNETGNQHLHFIQCDVTDWSSQVQFFKSAVKLSPHGGIDCVVASAGIIDKAAEYENPKGLDGRDPPPPNIAVMDINLTGVLYTTHLALFWLARNPGSSPASPQCDPNKTVRDRHLLLISSMAGLGPLPGELLYTCSKHAIVGLYRSLRSTVFKHGVRANLMCPYFVETPLIGAPGRAVLAGIPLAKIEDVIQAATRFVSNPQICGRAVAVGPQVRVKPGADEEWEWVADPGSDGRAVFEIFATDFDDVEPASRRIISLLNRATEIRGWYVWTAGVIAAIRHGIGL